MCISLYPRICAIVTHQWGTMKQLTQLTSYLILALDAKNVSAQ
jgi:hypothetical protein